jgi:hypothetical protein
MTTHRDRVLEFIKGFPDRDDDEIARVLKIPQRQAVNIICRELAQQGLIVRETGPAGKLVNRPASSGTPVQVRRQGSIQTAEIDADAEGQLAPRRTRPALTVERLTAAGFVATAHWRLEGGQLRPDQPIPATRGVYAFCKDGVAYYVGVASMGLKKRLYFYGKPGQTQRTSLRLNALLRQELGMASVVRIYTATPPDLDWNGLPVNGSAGLEIGLIESFDLPWNIRGSR